MDFDNMTKEELIALLKTYYVKCIAKVPNMPFEVGKYYYIEQTSGLYADVYHDNGIEYIDVLEIDEYFEINIK